MLLSIGEWVTVGVGLLAALVTLVSLSSSPHWSVRLWDFPRAQIALLAAAAGITHFAVFSQRRPLDWAFAGVTGLTALWQAYKIFPYTPIAPLQVQWSERKPAAGKPGRPSFRLLITNVLMENTQHDRILRVIRDADPDVILAVETNDRWARALQPLRETYPHGVDHPQENWYGLMLFSRLELVDCKVEFLVQDDIPSVFTQVVLPDGGPNVFLRGIHPRPPEPIRDMDSTPRDAELVVVGKLIQQAPEQPTVVAGDLNDVAWSPTSQLFARLASLLDPRRGRGFYNSYNANNPFLRYPLDHVFHTHHFRLVAMERLPNIGSDHFPMMVELSYEWDAPLEQPEPEPDADDLEEAEEKLDKQAEAAATGDDRPGRE